MAGSEILGDIEFELIKEVFSHSPAVLYRYHPKASMAKRFEAAIAERLGTRYAHAVSSGTAAIETALFAAGVESGDEVITTAFTFLAPVEAIYKLGAVPVCVEIDQTLNMAPAAIEAAITCKTKAICVVPMWGACAMDEIRAICERHKLALVEDSAQCLGGTYKGGNCGTFGAVASFSLDFGKTLSAGEAGFIVTNDEEIYRRASEYADHGHVHDTSVPRGEDGVRFPGFNYRISELTAAVALGQLSRMEDILTRQRQRKARLDARLAEIPNVTVRTSSDAAGETGDTTILTLLDAATATAVAQALADRKIGTKILPEAFRWHYAGAWPHIWSRYAGYDLDNLRGHWPKTYDLLARSIALGISVHENAAWDEAVIDAFRSVCSR